MRTIARGTFFVAAAGLTAALFSVRAATPPVGFEDHVVVNATAQNGAANAVGIAYEPGSGALFVLEKGDGTSPGNARVRRRDPSTGSVTTALTLTCVDSEGERGLLGIAFDPDYLTGSRYVYFYYTHHTDYAPSPCHLEGLANNGSYNRVVRYHESGGVLSGQEPLLTGPLLAANNHQGGTLRFGTDATLYISMGDNDTDAESPPAARNLNDLRGKILRINRDGTIPAGNPFVGQAGKRHEIWAWGLRNPFRISIDPANGNVFIADVGEGAYEEVDAGFAGADYGWPCFEASTPFRSCSPPPSGDVKPGYAYDHTQGDSIIGGPVYHGTAFPPDYEGQYFFGDYGGNWIRRATVLMNGALSDVTTFLTDATAVADMAVSPAGCLTWVSIGGVGVHDVCYAGGGNAQPQARSSGAPLSGLAPLTVALDGTASWDGDQDPMSYSWDYGDGTTGTAPAPQKTYATNGVRQAVLTVNDGSGAPNATDTAPPLRVVVGNRSPQGTITAPANGTLYAAGDTIAYSGTATDPEDGTLPASTFSWTIVFHHADHTHPFLGPIVGTKTGSFTIPGSGEDATNVFYRIMLSVTDSGAPLGAGGTIMQSSFVDVVPRITSLTAAASPSIGLQVEIDHAPSVAPATIATVVGFPRTLTAPSPQTMGGATWTFVSWSDGGAIEHVVSPPVSPTTYTATYQCTANCVSSPALMLSRPSPSTARLQWASLGCANSYDAVRGDLSSLHGSGSFTVSTQSCLANDLASTTLDDPAPPAAAWYLVRANGCGSATYDEGVAFQPASRDGAIAASGRACP